MLNEALYRQLERVYQNVVIHNEDMHLELNTRPVPRPAMGIHLSDLRVTSTMVEEGGEYYAVNCPFCKDTRQRLWVCHAWGSRVSIEGNPVPVSRGVIHCYNEHCMENTDNWRKFCDSLEGNWKPEIITVSTGLSLNKRYEPVAFPNPTYYVNDPHADPAIRNYLQNDRRYDLNELSAIWEFRYGQIDFYDAPVVIMPVQFDGACRFWQARYPTLGNIPETFRDGRPKPKYYIPAGAGKSLVLYNLERAIETDTIVLVEGIFDAVRIGPSGVAMFGKKPSVRQLAKLRTLASDKDVVWIPDIDDPEAVEAATKGTEMWARAGLFKSSRCLLLDKGDPADYTREELWRLINA